MRYLPGLFLRVGLCFVPFSVFYLVFLPLTLYGSAASLWVYAPKMINDSLMIGGKEFVFARSCVASAAYWLLWALAMLVKDVSLGTRVKVILTSFALFFGMNILRIVVLILLAVEVSPSAFDLVHVVMWKVVSGVYVAFVWILVVKVYGIDAVPLIDDARYLWRKSLFTRRFLGK
ncbi:MAG TPA: pacearchaeosortase [Candidatus Nanoarchaeia archaeon]|nr:pacearchaeosortase [Candidatus Nanoarchaeia archaeon]